jgi:hypothetical protein
MADLCFVNSLPGIMDPNDGSVSTNGTGKNKDSMAYADPNGDINVRIDGPYPLEGDLYNVENIQFQVFISKEDARNKIPVYYNAAFGRQGRSVLTAKKSENIVDTSTTMHRVMNLGYAQGKLYVKNVDTGKWMQISSTIPDVDNETNASALEALELEDSDLEEIANSICELKSAVIYSELDEYDPSQQYYYLKIRHGELRLARGTYVIRIFKEILSEDKPYAPKSINVTTGCWRNHEAANISGVDPDTTDNETDNALKVEATTEIPYQDQYWLKNKVSKKWEALKSVKPSDDVLSLSLTSSNQDSCEPPQNPVEFEQLKVFTLTVRSNPIQGIGINKQYWRSAHPRGYNMDGFKYHR